MLSRIEHAYLAILRVVILIAATIALIVASFGLVAGGGRVLTWAGITQAAKPSGGTLDDFVAEQRQSDATPQATSDDSTSAPRVLPDIATAARNVQKYLGSRSDTPESSLQTDLQRVADGMGNYTNDYAASVKALSEELLVSTGKPLSAARVQQLLNWHGDRFKADIANKADAEATDKAQFWVIAGAAGAAFVTFLLIIFISLFVKIERNLRVVKMTVVGNQADGHSDA